MLAPPVLCRLQCMVVPVGVEDGGGVAAEERQLIGGATTFVDGNDGEGATAAGFPVDGDVFRVGL